MSKKSPMVGEKTYSSTGVLRNFSRKLLSISNDEQPPLPDILATSFGTHTMSRWVSKKLLKLNLLFDGIVLEIHCVSQISVTTEGLELRSLTRNAVT